MLNSWLVVVVVGIWGSFHSPSMSIERVAVWAGICFLVLPNIWGTRRRPWLAVAASAFLLVAAFGGIGLILLAFFGLPTSSHGYSEFVVLAIVFTPLLVCLVSTGICLGYSLQYLLTSGSPCGE